MNLPELARHTYAKGHRMGGLLDLAGGFGQVERVRWKSGAGRLPENLEQD